MAGIQDAKLLAVLQDDIAIGSGGDFDIIFDAVQRSSDDEFLSPRLDGHGLLEDAVGIAIGIGGNQGEVVAVENSDFLAVTGCHPTTTQIETGAPIAIGRPHLIGLSSVQGDGKLLAGRLVAHSGHTGSDVNDGVVFSGHDQESAGVGRVIRGLVVGLDDVIVGQSLNGHDVRGVKRIGGNVSAIH